MSRRKSNLPLVEIVLGMMLATGTLLFIQDDRLFPEEISRNNQIYYAEISTTSSPYATLDTTLMGTRDVPILVYHIVRPAYADDSAEVRAFAQTPEVFTAQMQALQDRGYTVISFTDLERHLRDNALLPAKPIIISFDDGWSDQFEYAYPILRSYGYSATFFVFTNSIGRRGFLSWDNLKTLLNTGMTLGSHSRSHPYLGKIVDPTELDNEIRGSKQTLEDKLGIRINQFAYPFGQYNPAIVDLVQKAGYTSARGDAYSGRQSKEMLYTLSAVNVPTTLAGFIRAFP